MFLVKLVCEQDSAHVHVLMDKRSNGKGLGKGSERLALIGWRTEGVCACPIPLVHP
jgi:hypothetical protein